MRRVDARHAEPLQLHDEGKAFMTHVYANKPINEAFDK